MLTLEDIRHAAETLRGVVRRTQLVHDPYLSELTGAQLYLELEKLQRTGAYKLRGAYNKIQSLSPQERARGVIAASAGNHAQGVAYAARLVGIPATIVMPEEAPLTKVNATRALGAEVILSGTDYDDSYQEALRLQKERGLAFVHPFDDRQVMAGQGTVGLEIAEDLADAEAIIVSVGGGGLISGIAAAAKSLNPKVRLIGVQAEGCAPGVESFRQGHLVEWPAVHTIADGIKARRIGDLTFQVMQRYVDEMLTVSDEEIVQSIVVLLEKSKLVVEGAGAAGLAALLSGRLALPGRKVVVLISGGNIDLNFLSRAIARGLAAVDRYLIIRTRLPDRPGQLAGFLKLLAERGVNVLDIQHSRIARNVPVDQAEVELTVETRDRAHGEEILAALRQAGYEIEHEH
ncbi:MAG: threonine ammonia-lyase [Chloroflexi bacterium]|nr:threonine ammonia-lyase [Chloroflexota bacterium]